MPDDEYQAAQNRLREAAELRKRLADEAAAEREEREREEAEEAEEAEEEEKDAKSDNTRFMSADAKLTHLRLHWAILTLLVCMGISYLINQVDGENMRKAIEVAKEHGELSEEDAKLAEKGLTTFEQRDEMREKFKKLKLKKRQRQLADKARHILDGTEHQKDEEKPLYQTFFSRGITGEELREWMEEKSGDKWVQYRNAASAVAVIIGGLGLVVAAFMVRIAGALFLGALGAISCFIVGLDPMFVAGGGLVGALLGSFLAPRMLLASIYSNALMAGLIIGGIAGGGAIYMGSANELLALLGLGVGALFGAMVALKFARQIYLCSVLANTAGMAMLILWVVWGEQFPYFTQITFGGLMIIDAVLTRLYHKVRYR
jgi:uncharacterized membrane protein